MKKNVIAIIIGLLLIIGGGVLFVLPTLVRGANTKNAMPIAVSVAAPLPEIAVTGKPVAITIPSLNISLEIIDGLYNEKSQTWTLTNDKAQFATMTSQPNDVSGNTFIYGHNRREVFANLPKIQDKAEAIITTDNGHKFIYTFNNHYATNPNDATALGDSKDPILTLQTCTGLFYQNREMFIFNFKEVGDV